MSDAQQQDRGHEIIHQALKMLSAAHCALAFAGLYFDVIQRGVNIIETFGQWLCTFSILSYGQGIFAEFSVKNHDIDIWDQTDRILQIHQVLFSRTRLSVGCCCAR